MGNVTQIDSANIFVENTDSTVLTVSGSATGTYTGSDFTNLQNRGARFYIAFTSIFATSTVRINIQNKDSMSGLYMTVATVSLDGLTTGNKVTVNSALLYPGILAASVSVAGETPFGFPVSRVMRVIASITATASVSVGTGTFLTVNVDKIL